MICYFDANWYLKDQKNNHFFRLTWRDYAEVVHHKIDYSKLSSNRAEYKAFICLLKQLYKDAANNLLFPGSEILIRGDSQIVLYQMAGKYKVKAMGLKKLYNTASIIVERLATQYKIQIYYEWINRKQNNKALGLKN